MLFENLERFHNYAAWMSRAGFQLKAPSGALFKPDSVSLFLALHIYLSQGIEYSLIPPEGTKAFRVYPLEQSLLQRSIFAAKRKESIRMNEVISKLVGVEFFPSATDEHSEVFREEEDVFYLVFDHKTLEKDGFLKNPYILVLQQVNEIPLLVFPETTIFKVLMPKEKEQKEKKKKEETPFIKDSFEQMMRLDFAKVVSDLYGVIPEKTVSYRGKENVYVYRCPFCGAMTLLSWRDGEKWKFQCASCKRKGTVLHFIEYKENLAELEKKEREYRLAKFIAEYLSGKTPKGKDSSQEVVSSPSPEKQQEKQQSPDVGKEKSKEPEPSDSTSVKTQEFEQYVEFQKTFSKLISLERVKGKEAQVSIIRSQFSILLSTGAFSLSKNAGLPISLWLTRNNERFSIFHAVPAKVSKIQRRIASRLEGDLLVLESHILLTDKAGKFFSYRAGELYFKDSIEVIEKIKGFPFAGYVLIPSKFLPSAREFHVFSSLKEAFDFLSKKSSQVSDGKITIIVDPRGFEVKDDIFLKRAKATSSSANILSFLFFLRAKKNISGKYDVIFHGKRSDSRLFEEAAELFSDKNFSLKVEFMKKEDIKKK